MPSEHDPLTELVRFQVDRLRETYKDFLADPESYPLAKFFLEDVYTTKDKSSRDAGFKAIYEKFRDKLGRDLAENLGKMIELNDLTDKLDRKMVKKMDDMGVDSPFTEDEYEEAYYLCDNYQDREIQIDLTVHAVNYFHEMSRHRTIGVALMMIRPYALLKGARSLIDFLQGGYKAFRSVDEVTEFARTIHKRERERLVRIYSVGRQGTPSIGDVRKRARDLGIKNADKMTLRRLMREMQKWT